MLHYVSVPVAYAVVSKVTKEPQSGEVWLTVETVEPADKKAYRFKHLGSWKPRKGTTVLLSGKAKVEKRRGKLIFSPYYHEPMDGSPKDGWGFADMADADCIPVGPWEVVRAALEVERGVRTIVRGATFIPMDDLKGHIRAVRSYLKALEGLEIALKDSDVRGQTDPTLSV